MKGLLGILACGLCLGLFAVELSDGWTLAIDPKNEGKACDWAEAERGGRRFRGEHTGVLLWRNGKVVYATPAWKMERP